MLRRSEIGSRPSRNRCLIPPEGAGSGPSGRFTPCADGVTLLEANSVAAPMANRLRMAFSPSFFYRSVMMNSDELPGCLSREMASAGALALLRCRDLMCPRRSNRVSAESEKRASGSLRRRGERPLTSRPDLLNRENPTETLMSSVLESYE